MPARSLTLDQDRYFAGWAKPIETGHKKIAAFRDGSDGSRKFKSILSRYISGQTRWNLRFSGQRLSMGSVMLVSRSSWTSRNYVNDGELAALCH